MIMVSCEVMHLAFLMCDCHAYFSVTANAIAEPVGFSEGGFEIALLPLYT